MGVDLICISGGKHMRGPQCSGILAGRRDLVRAAWLNSSPHSDALGRPMKVGREEMVTAWLTVEKSSRLDFEAIDRECVRQAEYLERESAVSPASSWNGPRWTGHAIFAGSWSGGTRKRWASRRPK